MTDGDAILAAIRAHPDDDTPRLAYADWLDDLMTPEATARAAFIRVECRLARDFAGTAAGCPTPIRAGHQTPAHGLRVGTVVGPCNACEACRERAGLWAAWRESQGPKDAGAFAANCWEWFARHLTWADHFTTARGFVEHVTCPAADWLAHGDAVIAANPVRRVRLATYPDWCHRDGRVWLYEGPTPGPGRTKGRRCERVLVGDFGTTDLENLTSRGTYVRQLLAAEWPGVAFELLLAAAWSPHHAEEALRRMREGTWLPPAVPAYREADFTPLFDAARTFGEAATAAGRALIPAVSRVGEQLRPMAEAMRNNPEFAAALAEDSAAEPDDDPTAP